MSALSTRRAPDGNVVIGERTVRISAERRGAGTRGDAGSSLIFAMAFLLLGSLIVTTLAGWASSDLGSSAHFQVGRSLTYSADGAVSVAISETRYWYPSEQTYPWSAPCPNAAVVDFGQTTTPSGVPSFEPSISIATWCTLQVSGVGFSRLVTVQAYDVNSVGSAPLTTEPPSSLQLASATVGYMDSPSSSAGKCPPATCVTSMSIVTWSVK